MAYFLERFFVENKFMGLFSLLFGISFWLFLDRVSARTSSPTRLFYRRIFWLFVIGCLHGWLLWCFDILRFYALWAILLPLFVRMPRAATAPDRARLLRRDPSGSADLARAAAAPGPDFDAMALAAFSGRKLPRGPGRQLGVRLVSDEFHLSDWISSGDLWTSSARTLRCQIFGPRKHRRLSHATSKGVSRGSGGRLGWKHHLRRGPPIQPRQASLAFVRQFLVEGGQLGLTLAYASAVALAFLVVSWRRVIGLLAPIGQMALTWYLLQTAFGIWMFYGFAHGPALMGRVGPASLAAVCAVGFGAQVAFARAWMRRFQFGPAEWCWRSLTYGEVQPFRFVALGAGPQQHGADDAAARR